MEGCEAWFCQGKYKNMVNAVGRRYLRNVCGKVRMYRVSDEWVLKECGLKGNPIDQCEINLSIYSSEQDIQKTRWLKDLFWIGTKKDLEYSDLYNTLPSQLSDKLGDELESPKFNCIPTNLCSRNWDKEMEAARDTQRAPSLLRVLWKTYAWSYMWYGALTLVLTCGLRITTPIFLASLIAYFNPESTYTKSDAYMYAAALITCSLTTALCAHNISFGNQVVGMKIRVACCSLVYRKTLRLSRTALGQTETGKMVNLLSNDVNRFEQLTYFLHYLWVLPIQTIIIIAIIWQWVGVSAAIGVGTIFMQTIPVQLFISKFTSKLRMKIATRTDERVRMMSEIISGIQVIKMYAWEKPFEKMVALARRTEINVIRKASYLRGLNLSFMVFAERTTLFVTLASFVLMGNHITAEKVFSIAQYCNILNMTMAVASPIAMQMIAETKVSIKRLEKFLLQEEFQVAPLTQGSQVEKIGVTLDSVTARWLPSSISDTLHKVALRVNPGQLCAIIGPVGSGKSSSRDHAPVLLSANVRLQSNSVKPCNLQSSLLQILLGELPLSSGSMSLRGEVSYASQEPWLFVGTVRQNILFGQPYQPKRYKEVVRVCALTRDFELFPNGDKTIVGERGVSLSGGQRARINLARAVYREADIYLLDDPLSAVDTHVGRHLFEECVDTYLTKKIRILVTHQLQYLKEADLIVILNNGQIETQGTFQQLQESKFNFAQLLTSSEEDADEAVPPTMRQLSSQLSNQVTGSVIAEKEEELQEQLQEWNVEVKEWGVKCITAKCKGMVVTRKRVRLDGVELRKEQNVKYLGSMIEEKGGSREDLMRRGHQGEFFYMCVRDMLGRREVPLKCKEVLYRTYFVPIITYAAETRTVNLSSCRGHEKTLDQCPDRIQDECEGRDVPGTEPWTSGGDNEYISHVNDNKTIKPEYYLFLPGPVCPDTAHNPPYRGNWLREEYLTTDSTDTAHNPPYRGNWLREEYLTTDSTDTAHNPPYRGNWLREEYLTTDSTDTAHNTPYRLVPGTLGTTVTLSHKYRMTGRVSASEDTGAGVYSMLRLLQSLEEPEETEEPTETQELMSKGSLKSTVYMNYFKSGGGIYTLLFLVVVLVLGQMASSGADYWVTFWCVYMGRPLGTNLEQIIPPKSFETKLSVSPFRTNQEELRKYYSDLELEKSVFDLHENSTELPLQGVSNISDVGPQPTRNLSRNLTQEVIFSTETSLYIYTVCILGSVIITIIRSVVFFKVCMTASRRLHNTMFSSILQGTMRFFDTNPSGDRGSLIPTPQVTQPMCHSAGDRGSLIPTPQGTMRFFDTNPSGNTTYVPFCRRPRFFDTNPSGNTTYVPFCRGPRFFDTNLSGRVLNRFSKDMGSVDEMLPKTLIEATQVTTTSVRFLKIFLVMAGILVMVTVVNYLLMVPMVFVGLLFYKIRQIYLGTGQDMKRLEGATRSPVFSHLAASLNGLTTIRACGAQQLLRQEFDSHQSSNPNKRAVCPLVVHRLRIILTRISMEWRGASCSQPLSWVYPTPWRLGSALFAISRLHAESNQIFDRLVGNYEWFCPHDLHTSSFYLTIATSVAFGFWLDVVSNIFVACVAFSFLLLDEGSLGADVGLAISQSLILTGMLQHGIRMSTEVVNHMTAVERILEYTKIDKEPGPESEPGTKPLPSWPPKGEIQFVNTSMRYSSSDPPVLRELTFNIEPAWKNI
uniref:(California timema) hypothetical protein n=1 Tax=Timema californicum TaxID=61474 RepID=A0A7R9P718_TIMCA|nr:unnamed protein product [Timema californicum]